MGQQFIMAATMDCRIKLLLTVIGPTLVSISSAQAPKDHAPDTVIAGTIGLTTQNGTTTSQTYNVLLSADRAKRGVDTIHLDGGYFFSRQSTATDPSLNVASNFAFINGRYDREFSKQLAAYFSAGYRVDNPDNLYLRSLYGGGAACNVYEGKTGKWNLSAGGAYLIQRFTDGQPTAYTPSAAFGSQFNHSVGNKLTISHTLSYIPAFRDFSNYVLTSVFSLGYQVSKPLKLTINNVVDYQSDPSPGSLKKSSQWFLGLSFTGKA